MKRSLSAVRETCVPRSSHQVFVCSERGVPRSSHQVFVCNERGVQKRRQQRIKKHSPSRAALPGTARTPRHHHLHSPAPNHRGGVRQVSPGQVCAARDLPGKSCRGGSLSRRARSSPVPPNRGRCRLRGSAPSGRHHLGLAANPGSIRWHKNESQKKASLLKQGGWRKGSSGESINFELT
jgi:hypothetical protein